MVCRPLRVGRVDVQQATPPAPDADHGVALGGGPVHHRLDAGVQAGDVTAAGQDSDSHGRSCGWRGSAAPRAGGTGRFVRARAAAAVAGRPWEPSAGGRAPTSGSAAARAAAFRAAAALVVYSLPAACPARQARFAREGVGTTSEARPDGPTRLRLEVRGAVQGVGFRPFVFRLAGELALPGWVAERRARRVHRGRGPARRRWSASASAWPPSGRRGPWCRAWRRRGCLRRATAASSSGTARRAARRRRWCCPTWPPARTAWPRCCDPRDRRHRYPFTNCTNCGPRFTIMRELPYDRPNTTMRGFILCPACRAEYDDPRDRRFHAQPIACPSCGPRAASCGARTARRVRRAATRRCAAAAARAAPAGRIVAVKGLGGFHLMCDARDEAAVARLRERKLRLGKPLALMARDLEMARAPVRGGRAGRRAPGLAGGAHRAAAAAGGRRRRPRRWRRATRTWA